MVQGYSEESWQQAKQICAMIGLAPTSFSHAIRSLRKDAQSGGKLSPVSRYYVAMLLRSRSVRVCLYHAALTFYPAILEEFPVIHPETFPEIFDAEELSALLGMVLLYKRVRKGCDTEKFEAFSGMIHALTDLGGFVGLAIPKVGVATGTFVGGIRHIAMAMFLGIDQDNFIKYRRKLKLEGRSYDLRREVELWGCNHIQIATLMLQLLGIGLAEAASLLKGLEIEGLPERIVGEPNEIGPQVALLWLESLYGTGEPPKITHLGGYYPMATELKTLITRTEELRDSGSKLRWLSKTKADMTPELEKILKDTKAPPAPPKSEHPGELENAEELEGVLDE